MFKVISHTADTGIEVSGNSLEELFIDAAYGWKYNVIENSLTKAAGERKVELEAASLEDLMVQWLNELNFFLTVHHWILHKVTEAKVSQQNSGWRLRVVVAGEPLNNDLHEICIEIKSVTYHQLQIKRMTDRYKTRIIFDI